MHLVAGFVENPWGFGVKFKLGNVEKGIIKITGKSFGWEYGFRSVISG